MLIIFQIAKIGKIIRKEKLVVLKGADEWVTIGYYGFLWVTMSYNGFLWATMSYNRLQWVTIKFIVTYLNS